MAGPPSILVIRLSSLGDVLFAVPAVQTLQQHWPGSVAWLVEDRASALLSLVEGLDEVLVFPRRHPARWVTHARALWRRRDAVVLDLQSNAKSRLQRLACRAPRRLGFDAPFAKEGGQRGLTQRFLPRPRAHKVGANLEILGLLGIPVPARPPRPRLRWPGASDERAEALLARLPGEGPVVVLHPGTSAFGELKRWAPERFGLLARRLVVEHDARVLVSGGPGEEGLLAAVREAARRSSVAPERLPLAVPPSGLADLAALLARADLLVAADSLPLHLGNALATPVVGLYGPKDPLITGPAWDGASVVRSGVACSPCTLRRCGERLCMERLTVEAVSHAALERLAAGRLLPGGKP